MAGSYRRAPPATGAALVSPSVQPRTVGPITVGPMVEGGDDPALEPAASIGRGEPPATAGRRSHRSGRRHGRPPCSGTRATARRPERPERPERTDLPAPPSCIPALPMRSGWTGWHHRSGWRPTTSSSPGRSGTPARGAPERLPHRGNRSGRGPRPGADGLGQRPGRPPPTGLRALRRSQAGVRRRLPLDRADLGRPGRPGPPSAPAAFETGLGNDDWRGLVDPPGRPVRRPSPDQYTYARPSSPCTAGPIARARAYVSGRPAVRALRERRAGRQGSGLQLPRLDVLRDAGRDRAPPARVDQRPGHGDELAGPHQGTPGRQPRGDRPARRARYPTDRSSGW